MKRVTRAVELILAILTVASIGTALPESASSIMDMPRDRQRWLPLREIQRLFRPAPREVSLFAAAFSQECAAALESRLAGHGYDLNVVVAPDPVDLADAVSNSRHTDAITLLLLAGNRDPEGWRLPIFALLNRDAYGPTTLLAVRSLEYRDSVLKAARAYDMAVADLTGLEAPDEMCETLAAAVLSLSKPHPGLYGFALFPIVGAALLGLRLRSRAAHVATPGQ
jgi:hypothetical protein